MSRVTPEVYSPRPGRREISAIAKLSVQLIRKHRIALLAAATFNFVLFFPTLFMQRVLSPNDVFFNYGPWSMVKSVDVQNSLLHDPPMSLLTLIALLRDGDAFHWNPYIAAGVPGTGSAALISPFIVIPTFTVPLAWVYTAIIFLKLNAGFLFAYLWLREEGLGRRGAAVGAIVFAGAGIYSIRWLWQMTNATALYPAWLWMVRRIFNGKRVSIPWVTLLAFSYALAGFPAAMAYGAYVAVLYALYLSVRTRRFPLRSIGAACAATVLGLLIASPSLVSFAQLVRRSGYLAAREALSSVHFPLSHARSFIEPLRMGSPASKDWIGDRSLGMLNNFFEATIYVGIVAIPLALFALLNRRARSRWFWLAMSLLVLGTMFGVAFVPDVIRSLPGFRYSALSRSSLLLPLCAGYLAGAGAAFVSRWRFRNAVAMALACVAAFDLALFAGRFYSYLRVEETEIPATPTIQFLQSQPRPFRIAPSFIYLWPNTSEMFELEDIRSHFSSEAMYRKLMSRVDPTSWSGQNTVIQFNTLHFDPRDPIVSMLGVRYLIEEPKIDILKWGTFKETKPGVEELGHFVIPANGSAERTITVGSEPFWAIEMPIGMEKISSDDPRIIMQLRKFGVLVYERSFTNADLQAVGKVYIPLRPYAREGDVVTFRIATVGTAARMLGSVPVQGESPFFYGRVETPIVFDRLFPEGRLFVNLAALPRFWAAGQGIAMSSEEFLKRKDLDLSRIAALTNGGAAFEADASTPSIELLRYSPGEQRLRTESKQPFFLASSEKLTPELAIEIDGKRVDAVEINTMFAGVHVPAGNHRVIFSRRLGRGWWGIAAAALAVWLAIVASAIARALTRKRGRGYRGSATMMIW